MTPAAAVCGTQPSSPRVVNGFLVKCLVRLMTPAADRKQGHQQIFADFRFNRFQTFWVILSPLGLDHTVCETRGEVLLKEQRVRKTFGDIFFGPGNKTL